MATQQKAVPAQLRHPQSEIKQLQTQNQQQATGLQKEIKKLEAIK